MQVAARADVCRTADDTPPGPRGRIEPSHPPWARALTSPSMPDTGANIIATRRYLQIQPAETRLNA